MARALSLCCRALPLALVCGIFSSVRSFFCCSPVARQSFSLSVSLSERVSPFPLPLSVEFVCYFVLLSFVFVSVCYFSCAAFELVSVRGDIFRIVNRFLPLFSLCAAFLRDFARARKPAGREINDALSLSERNLIAFLLFRVSCVCLANERPSTGRVAPSRRFAGSPGTVKSRSRSKLSGRLSNVDDDRALSLELGARTTKAFKIQTTF